MTTFSYLSDLHRLAHQSATDLAVLVSSGSAGPARVGLAYSDAVCWLVMGRREHGDEFDTLPGIQAAWDVALDDPRVQELEARAERDPHGLVIGPYVTD